MNRSKDIMIGSRDRFAVRFGFLPDPDEGRGISREVSLSWGCFELWVHGRNLTQHVELNEPMQAVHWYLLPLLEWFASNWDFYLHEERVLPASGRDADSAWSAMRESADPPSSRCDDEVAKWEEDWYGWWQRHSILAAREGGLFPSIVVRRCRDLIEISWGEEQLAGCPGHFRFSFSDGFARLDPTEVVQTLHEALRDASSHLLSQMPDSRRLRRLQKDVEHIGTSDNRRRLGLLAGFQDESRKPEEYWDKIEAYFSFELDPEAKQAVLAPCANELIVSGSCHASLMFGSVSPTIGLGDAEMLARELATQFSSAGEESRLAELCSDRPLGASSEPAWKQGYSLAEELIETLHSVMPDEGPVDIEAIYNELGIGIRHIRLVDRKIRAVAIAGPRHKPAVLLNAAEQYRGSTRRRFTLAHELCHILHDRSYGARLAMASGPWAPSDVERRASAFAAMLLMPKDHVPAVVSRLTDPVEKERAIWEVANHFQTSFTATLDHLCNLGYLDEDARWSIRDRIAAGARQE